METFRQQNASVSVDELCVLLVSRVNEHAAQRMCNSSFLQLTHLSAIQYVLLSSLSLKSSVRLASILVLEFCFPSSVTDPVTAVSTTRLHSPIPCSHPLPVLPNLPSRSPPTSSIEDSLILISTPSTSTLFLCSLPFIPCVQPTSSQIPRHLVMEQF